MKKRTIFFIIMTLFILTLTSCHIVHKSLANLEKVETETGNDYMSFGYSGFVINGKFKKYDSLFSDKVVSQSDPVRDANFVFLATTGTNGAFDITKFDILNQTQETKRLDKTISYFDSYGNDKYLVKLPDYYSVGVVDRDCNMVEYVITENENDDIYKFEQNNKILYVIYEPVIENNIIYHICKEAVMLVGTTFTRYTLNRTFPIEQSRNHTNFVDNYYIEYNPYSAKPVISYIYDFDKEEGFTKDFVKDCSAYDYLYQMLTDNDDSSKEKEEKVKEDVPSLEEVEAKSDAFKKLKTAYCKEALFRNPYLFDENHISISSYVITSNMMTKNYEANLEPLYIFRWDKETGDIKYAGFVMGANRLFIEIEK